MSRNVNFLISSAFRVSLLEHEKTRPVDQSNERLGVGHVNFDTELPNVLYVHFRNIRSQGFLHR